MSNILVIENQKKQFQEIYKFLSKDGKHEVFPKPDRDYDQFIDYVRIHLNNRYERQKTDMALKLVKDYIAPKDIDLLLVDFKLIGCYFGGTGIDLVENLGTELPVIFLSRTPFNTEDIHEKIQKIAHWEWVDKGYSGDRILNEPYFRLHVLPKIKKLTGEALGSKARLQALQRILSWPLPVSPKLKDQFTNTCKHLSLIKHVTKEQITLIDEILERPKDNELKEKIILLIKSVK